MSSKKNKWQPPAWDEEEENYQQVWEKKIHKDEEGNVIVKVFIACCPANVEQYNFNVQEPVHEIQIAREGGVNTNKPWDPQTINTGGNAEQEAEKEFNFETELDAKIKGPVVGDVVKKGTPG